MAQVNSSPGVPRTLPTVVASSATPIFAGPPHWQGAGIIGTGVVSTVHVLSWVSSTGTDNIWASVVTASAVVVPFESSTPIVIPPEEPN